MPKFRDLTGERFGRWTVQKLRGKRDGYHEFIWRCVCDCGNRSDVQGSTLKNGRSRSCGCLSREQSTTHGMEGTPTYNSWAHMLSRCRHSGHKQWADYGGRGIKVCERWERFENFLADMGEKPAGMSLDRIDNDGDYKPGNCRWTDQTKQIRNRRNSPRYQYKGSLLSLSEICELESAPRRRVFARMKAGWTLERALSEGSRKRR